MKGVKKENHWHQLILRVVIFTIPFSSQLPSFFNPKARKTETNAWSEKWSVKIITVLYIVTYSRKTQGAFKFRL